VTRGGSSVPYRLRLRRRLLMFSAPVAIVVVLAAAKLISVAVAGDSAASNFADGDAGAMRDDVATLNVLNVIQPAKASFAAGALAVLDGRLDEADAHFSENLSRTAAAQSCPVRVNLELVRERQGDVDAWEGRKDQARERYGAALAVIEAAPPGCFGGNTDPDTQRRKIRNDAAARLAAKVAALDTPAPAAPPPVPEPATPPAAPPAPAAPESEVPQSGLRLNPGNGDPIDRLRQLMEDAAG
jgi:hypothetical protein